METPSKLNVIGSTANDLRAFAEKRKHVPCQVCAKLTPRVVAALNETQTTVSMPAMIEWVKAKYEVILTRNQVRVHFARACGGQHGTEDRSQRIA